MTAVPVINLAEHHGPIATEVLRRSDGRCEVGARGCDPLRARMGFLHVDDQRPIQAGTVLHVCRPCRARCEADPALALRLAGVPA